jgi:hypothetical protein
MTFAPQNSYSPRAAVTLLAPACRRGVIDADGRRTLLAQFKGIGNCAVNPSSRSTTSIP